MLLDVTEGHNSWYQNAAAHVRNPAQGTVLLRAALPADATHPLWWHLESDMAVRNASNVGYRVGFELYANVCFKSVAAAGYYIIKRVCPAIFFELSDSSTF